jgi:hypothetical protein
LTARAAELGRDDAMTLASTGFAIANILNDLDAGVALIDSTLGQWRIESRRCFFLLADQQVRNHRTVGSRP